MDDITKACQLANVTLATWSPGDGTTRYRFFAGREPRLYHSGDGEYTALGRRQAVAWLTGRLSRYAKVQTT